MQYQIHTSKICVDQSCNYSELRKRINSDNHLWRVRREDGNEVSCADSPVMDVRGESIRYCTDALAFSYCTADGVKPATYTPSAAGSSTSCSRTTEHLDHPSPLRRLLSPAFCRECNIRRAQHTVAGGSEQTICHLSSSICRLRFQISHPNKQLLQQ